MMLHITTSIYVSFFLKIKDGRRKADRRLHINAHGLTDGDQHIAELRFGDHPVPIQVVHAESPEK